MNRRTGEEKSWAKKGGAANVKDSKQGITCYCSMKPNPEGFSAILYRNILGTGRTEQQFIELY